MRITKGMRRRLARENSQRTDTLELVPRALWPDPSAPQLRVWRSRAFLVQEFAASAPAAVRLSISRTRVFSSGSREDGHDWQDGITWDQLQAIKHEIGYGEFDAVEVFPASRDVVNVANMRHLWVLLGPLPFAWRALRPHELAHQAHDEEGPA